MDKGISLGETVVSCEGYDYPGRRLNPLINEIDDPYILVGSCGVRFKLERNADYYSHHRNHHHDYNDYNYYNNGGFWSWFDNIANIIFAVSFMNSFYFRLSLSLLSFRCSG